jgi:serine/threonine protein kinase
MHKFAIDAQAWAELNQLLDAALDQPAALRGHWLDTLAPEFDALKPQLRDLLSRAGGVETGDFFNTLPKLDIDAREWAPADARIDAGDQVGPYRLVRELGDGGMGTVWLAERTDGLISRCVALKLPHGAWKRAGLAGRMAREREILATLNHPNIARLYDAGLTGDGQPYLALEYVEGRPIDEYCQDRTPDLRSRLELFAQVANAVAYAHGKLIVHRDLKPANILVTAEAQVRLLDFGIAKLLEEGEAKETRLTRLSGRALTPDYASPEQILGEPLTVTSDVYSLGVILYELLTGIRPYKLKRDSRGALEDAILQAEPALPSAVADRRRSKSLRGDLDTIVQKALKKKPEERYATVHALLDDIRRHLSARPVLAQPDSTWYRVGRFVVRNKLAVGVSAAIFLATLIGVSAVAWQAQVARAEKARAEEVKEFIAAVFREADPQQGRGKVLSAAELLRQAERRLQERGDADPAMQLELLAILGESLFGLQESADAARVIEQALRLQASAAVPNDLLNARLHLILSQAYELLGRNDAALAELALSLSVLTASGHTSSPLFVQAKLQQAALGIVFSDYALAESSAHEAIDAASATLGPRSAEVAAGLQQLSHVYTLTQRRDMALAPARQAFEVQLKVHARDSNHPRLIESALYYGQALHAVGDFDAAAVVYADATARALSAFGGDSRMFGELLSAAVPLEIDIGDLRPAIDHAHRAIEIYLKEGEPGSVAHAGRVRKLGNALLAARESSAAAGQIEEAIRLAVAAGSDLETVHARTSFGLVLAYLGRFDEADRLLRQTLDNAGSKPTRAQHLAMRNFGTSLRLQGRHADALPWLEKGIAAAAIQRSHRGDLALGLVEAGLSKLELGDAEAAQELFVRADTLLEDLQKKHTTPARADLLVGMARVQMQRGNHRDALPLLESADLFWRDFDSENRWAGEAALWLGRCYLALGRRTDAHAVLSRAETVLASSPIPADTKLAQLARKRG